MLHPKGIAQAVKDCKAFQDQGAVLLAEAYTRPGYNAERAGNDFWLTRCHHGCGFWDRDELVAGDLGDKLTALAHGFGERWVTIDATGMYID
jgi:hypothetical protein